MFRPYLGAGVNATLISKVAFFVPTIGSLALDSTSFGGALQAGLDIRVADHSYLNADAKYVQIRSKLNVGGAKLSELRIDPLLYGVGLGYRF